MEETKGQDKISTELEPIDGTKTIEFIQQEIEKIMEYFRTGILPQEKGTQGGISSDKNYCAF